MSEFKARPYDSERDLEAVRRIWRECGWLGKDNEEEIDLFIDCGRALVSEVEGEAECLVLSAPGAIRYLDQDLPLAVVTGVTTSRIARKLGLASHLAAQVIAQDALDGALVGGLGAFEQGFYNRLGFGTGAYEHWVAFDPARLKVTGTHRVPKRFDKDDWARVHRARLRRTRMHGGCTITPSEITRLETRQENNFGLGYVDGEGELTHGFWCEPKEAELGPYHIHLLFYRTPEEFRELLVLIQSLGDQVRSVGMREPPGVMLQDFLLQPFKERQITKRSPYESRMTAQAYLQFRMLDVPGCLAHTRLPYGETRFNLRLRDPIREILPDDSEWRGVSGEYVVSLGAQSGAERGTDDSLPTLAASVGAFTRLWLGVLPATGLSLSDELAGPPALLKELDHVLRLPTPRPDWDF